MDLSNSTDETFKTLKKKILPLIQNKIFLGRYTEKRYVESLQQYRDVIVIESNEDIVQNLMKAKEIFDKYSGKKWIGISNDPQNPESENCLIWTYLNNVSVGKHWFQLSAVRLESREIFLEIEYVQPYRSPDKSILHSDDPDFPKFDINEILTYKNVREAIKFTAIVLMAFFTFAIEVVRFLGEYSIKISHVIVNLVQVSTPICLGIFDFLTKCVGGFYWLIYVMFRGGPNTPTVPGALLNNQRQIGYRRLGTPDYRQTNFPKSRYSYSPELPEQKKFISKSINRF